MERILKCLIMQCSTFRISSVINKSKNQFFDKLLSRNTYSLLINYMNSVTKALLLITEQRMIFILDQTYAYQPQIPVIEPLPDTNSTLSPNDKTPISDSPVIDTNSTSATPIISENN